MRTVLSRNVFAGLPLLIFLSVGAWASPAASQPATEGTPSERSSWYGYQTLATDGAALALAVIAADQESNPAMVGAIGFYLLGAPAVHALHRRPFATLGSLGMRIFLPLLGSGLGSATADCSTPVVNDENCDFGESIVGFGLGMAAAVVLDSALLAWDRQTPPPPIHSATAPASSSGVATSPTTLSLSPVLIRGGGGLVVGGLF